MTQVAGHEATVRKEILLKEYERLCSDIRSIETTNEKLLGFGFTIISLAAVAGVAQKVDEIFFLLPIAVVGTLAYVSSSYVALYSMAGYKNHIEDLLNEIAEDRLLLWEGIAERREKQSLASRLLWIIYLIVAVSIFSLSINRVIADQSILTGICLAGITLVLCFALWAGLRQMQGTKAWAYDRSRKLYAQAPAREVAAEASTQLSER